MKERLAVFEITKALNEYSVILLQGLRKVGKTTALKQIKARLEKFENKKCVYVDCREKDSENQIIQAMAEDETILFIDEFHYHVNCYYIAEELSQKADANKKFKTIITSSCVPFINTLARTVLGGGRAKRIRMPILTFIEYLYFSDKISSYNDSANRITEKDFMDYASLKSIDGYSYPIVDMEYIDDLVQDKDLAYANLPVHLINRQLKKDDILNAMKLLAYKLGDEVTYDKYKTPDIGAKELTAAQLAKYRNRLQGFSISKASLEIKTLNSAQISRALYFLLYSDLGVLCSINRENAKIDWKALENGMTAAELDQFFDNYMMTIINPLFYSILSEELKELVGVNIDFNDPQKGKKIYGAWIETYLRASYARKNACAFTASDMLKETDNNGTEHELDIYDQIRGVIIECKSGDKRLRETHFKYFEDHAKKSTCILTSLEATEPIVTENFTVYRVPYQAAAVYFDKMELPPLK